MFRHRFLILVFLPVLLLTALLMGIASTAQAQSTILYVNRDAAGSNNGSSWADAFTDLQGALTVANANPANSYEVWVAKGVYTPGITRTASFSLTHNNAQIYGGFAATETLRTERDWATNLTVLSGDIDGNDGVDANGVVTDTANIVGDNSYHVLWLDGVNYAPITGTTVIDGFTITGGNADDSDFPDNSGGGLFCAGNGAGKQCSPSLTNLVFSGNRAYEFGGGMYNYSGSHVEELAVRMGNINSSSNGVSSPSLTNVTFSGNRADYGGGMYNNSRSNGISSPSLVNVTFNGNRSAFSGGGMYNNGEAGGVSSPSLTDVTFSDNTANQDGGGMYNNGENEGMSSPILASVIFSGNTADEGGGGMYNNGAFTGVSSPNLTGVTFSSNSANYGGGVYNDGSSTGVSSPNLADVTLSSNSATNNGGGMYNRGEGGVSSPTLINVAFSGNTANEDGGGVYSDSSFTGLSSPSLTDVTFSSNSATNNGGAMYNNGEEGVSSPSLINVTFTRNTANQNGGGIYNIGSQGGTSSPSLTNVTFGSNTANENGGAMYNNGTSNGKSSPSLTNVTFSGNSVGLNGGGIYNEGEEGGVSSPSLLNVIFSGNRADNFGGGIFNDDNSSPSLMNIIFSGNKAESGGGMYNNSSPSLTNVTFSGNLAVDSGGGIYNNGIGTVSAPVIRNSLFWNNRQGSGQSSIVNESATANISYSLVEGCNPGGVWASACGADGGNNLADADPIFVTPIDATTAPTTTGNLRLQAGSPALNIGDNAALPAGVTTDLDGNPRIVNGVVDLGAYEFAATASMLYLPSVQR